MLLRQPINRIIRLKGRGQVIAGVAEVCLAYWCLLGGEREASEPSAPSRAHHCCIFTIRLSYLGLFRKGGWAAGDAPFSLGEQETATTLFSAEVSKALVYQHCQRNLLSHRHCCQLCLELTFQGKHLKSAGDTAEAL